MATKRLRTPQEAQQWFIANGVAVRAWAREHKISPHAVRDVLRGKLTGRRGEAHRAAVALRIKLDPKESDA